MTCLRVIGIIAGFSCLTVFSHGTTTPQCNNFYDYVCNSWKGKTPLKERIKNMKIEPYATMMKSLTNKLDSPFTSYYYSCMDRDRSRMFIEKKFRKIIQRTYKGPPLTEDDLAVLLEEMSTSDNGFFESAFNSKDKNKYIIAARKRTMNTMIRKNNKDKYGKYEKFVKMLFNELDCLYDVQDWKKVLDLEQNIIKLIGKAAGEYKYEHHVNNGKIFFNKDEEKIEELQKKFKNNNDRKFNILKFLKKIEEITSKRGDNIKVLFLGLKYFKELEKILNRYDLNITARYILLRSILPLYESLPERFQNMAKNISHELHIRYLSEGSDNECNSETNYNLKYIYEQFYMDTIFSGKTKTMAEELYKKISEAFTKSLTSLTCQDNKTFDKQNPIKETQVGRFELPFLFYHKTAFYNGSYFENLLAHRRDAIQTVAEGEKGIGIQNLTNLRYKEEVSYYVESTKTLYILSHAFNTSTKEEPEFYGTAGPHIVEALFKVIGKDNFDSCLKEKEFYLTKKLDFSYQALKSPKDKNLISFFFNFAKEFCNTEEGKWLNKVLQGNAEFKKTFECNSK